MLQSKLVVRLGGVQKPSSKKERKASRAAALQAPAPAADPTHQSPVGAPSPTSNSPEGEEVEREPAAGLGGRSSNDHSITQQAAGDEGEAGACPTPEAATNNSSEPEEQKSASPVSRMPDGDSPNDGGDPSGPGSSHETDLKDSMHPTQAVGIKAVPSNSTFKRLVRASAHLDSDSRSASEAAGGVQGVIPTPNKNTPSKATPNKRPREAVGSSPAAGSPALGVEQLRGLEGGLSEGTPGKRRRSLLPQSPLMKKLPSWRSQVTL